MDHKRPQPSYGQPQRKENIRHILFKTPTNDTRMKKKSEMGFKGITINELTEVLLRHAAWWPWREPVVKTLQTNPDILNVLHFLQ